MIHLSLKQDGGMGYKTDGHSQQLTSELSAKEGEKERVMYQ